MYHCCLQQNSCRHISTFILTLLLCDVETTSYQELPKSMPSFFPFSQPTKSPFANKPSTINHHHHTNSITTKPCHSHLHSKVDDQGEQYWYRSPSPSLLRSWRRYGWADVPPRDAVRTKSRNFAKWYVLVLLRRLFWNTRDPWLSNKIIVITALIKFCYILLPVPPWTDRM